MVNQHHLNNNMTIGNYLSILKDRFEALISRNQPITVEYKRAQLLSGIRNGTRAKEMELALKIVEAEQKSYDDIRELLTRMEDNRLLQGPVKVVPKVVNVDVVTYEDQSNKIFCRYCKKRGHMVEECPVIAKKNNGNKPMQSKFVNKEDNKIVTCAYCDKKGHSAQDCRKLIKDKGTAVVNQVVMEEIMEVSEIYRVVNDKCVVALDTCAAKSVFKDVELLDDLHEGPPIKFKGFDGSTQVSSTYGTYGKFGEVLHVPQAQSNLLSFSQLIQDKKNIQYSRKEDTFEVYDGDNNILGSFSNNDHIYSDMVKESQLQSGTGPDTYVQHPEEPERIFTAIGDSLVDPVQYPVHPEQSGTIPEIVVNNVLDDKCLEFDRLHRHCSHPSDATMVKMVREGHVLNCSLTAKDIARIREEIGKCIGCSRGKMTQQYKFPSTRLQEEDIGALIHVDIMFFGGNIFVLSVDDASRYIMAKWIKSKKVEDVIEGLRKTRNIYLSYGHVVKVIQTDAEVIFEACEPFFSECHIRHQTTSPAAHEVLAERNTRTLKERTRAVIFGVPYRVPKIAWKYAVEQAARGINLTPNSMSGSETPEEMFTGKKIDFKTDIRACFGDLGLFHIPNKKGKESDTKSQNEFGIVLGHKYNSKGDLKVYVPSRHQVLTRHKFDKVENVKDLNSLMDIPSDEELLLLDDPIDLPTPLVDTTPDNDLMTTIPSESPTDIPVVNELPEDDDWNEDFEAVVNMTVREAMKLNPEKSTKAIEMEFQQLVEQNTWTPVDPSTIPKDKLKEIISSHLIVVEKLHPDGSVDKWKARVTARGDQEIVLLRCFRSPTADIVILWCVLAVVAGKGMQIQTIDVKGAYLKVALDRDQYMVLTGEQCKIYTNLYPETKKFVSNGKLFVKLNKALYGLKESAYLWYEHMKASLLRIGFVQSQSDQCLFTWKGRGLVYAVLWVDDLFIASEFDSDLKDVNDGLFKEYGDDLKIKTGNKVEYLGMDIEINSDKSVSVTQTGYVDELLKRFETTKSSKTPVQSNGHTSTGDKELIADGNKEFISKVMSVMYLAKRTRPDLLKPITDLATKCHSPTIGDVKAINKLLEYIMFTKDDHIRFDTKDYGIYVYSDASYQSHPDGKGHSGTIISIGKHNTPVFAKSCKQKIVTLSSTEAELVAFHEGFMRGLWVKAIVNDLGIDTKFITMYQDNMSTIQLLKNGGSHSFKSRHINGRYYYAKQFLDTGELVVEHLSTTNMVADMLTKNLDGTLLKIMKGKILNMK
jgi:hypothetical protein